MSVRKFKCIFFCFAVLPFSGNSVFAADHWSLLPGLNEDGILVQANYKEFYQKPKLVEIKKSNNFTTPDVLLSNYYWYLKKNDFQALSKLYYDKDGSRKKFEQEISSNRLDLKAYRNLGSVQLKEELLWGNYHFFSVQLIAHSGAKQNWIETVYCEQRCWMKFDFLETSPVNEIADIIRASYWSSLEVNGRQTDPIKSSNFVLLNLNPNSLQGSNIGVNASFYLKLSKSSNGRIENFSDCKGSKELIKFLCSYFDGSKKVDVSDEESVNKYKQQFWTVNATELVRRNFEGKEKFYTYEALISELVKISSVSVVGTLELKNRLVIFLRPIVKYQSTEKILPIQSIILTEMDGVYKLDASIENDFIFRVFTNSLFLNELSKII